MAPTITPEFIDRIPKTDLHLHLDGSLRLPTLIELARTGKVTLPSYEEEGLRRKVFKTHYEGLREYLAGFACTCAVLQTAENLERAAFELAEDNIAEGVRYIEVRFAPQLHAANERSARDVMRAVCHGIERAKKEHNATPAVKSGEDLSFEYGVIVCALRSFSRETGPYFAGLLTVLPRAPRKEVFSIASLEIVREAVDLRDGEGLPIVGFDLAGEEAGYPAASHSDAYEYVHNHFLMKTVHAGEAYGPESIFQAITICHANRIGHGTFLLSQDTIRDRSIKDPVKYVAQLADYVASRRITIEVCLTSNLQTLPSIQSVEKHTLGKMIEHDLSVSICTDNRLISDTTVTRELRLVAEHLPMTKREFRKIIIAGFKGSFFPRSYIEKRAYVRKAISLYDKAEAELLPE